MASVSGGVSGAEQGTLAIMAGGHADHIDIARQVLKPLYKQLTHMGPVGSGQTTKICNQMIVSCNMLVIEGLKRKEKQEKQVNYICLERHFGRFCRTVEIPPAFDIKGVKAKYDRGVLAVAFPRLKDRSTVIRNIPIE